MPSIELLAKPEEKLAGLRFDAALLTPSRMDYATSLTIQHLGTGKQQEMQLPDNSEGIRYIQFHPSKPLFVFCSKVKNELFLELFKCELDDDNQWSMEKVSHLSQRRMNFVNGCAYQFTSDGNKLLVKVVPENWPETPPEVPISTGPSIQLVQKNARKAPGRTYQDLLKNQHDEDKLKYFLTTELLCVNITSPFLDVKPISQSSGGKLIQSLQCSPSGRFLLVHLTTDFSYSVPLGRFGKNVQIWDLESDQTVAVASIPVDDEIPLSYDACSRHPRSFHFHPCQDHMIIFVKAVDGGDPDNEPVDGDRDVLYTQTLDENNLNLGDATKLVGLEWRFADVEFCESGLGVVDSYRWKDRMERKWLLNKDGSKRMLWERTWEDRYTAPGGPVTRRGGRGQHFIVQPTPTSMYLKGAGASELGDRPFLDLLDFASSETKTTRLWRCTAPLEGELDASKEVNGVLPTERKDIYESLVCLLPDNDSILISREGKTIPRNYYLTKLSDSKSEIQVTEFAHPQPDLLGVKKELVSYKRKDGVELTANMYLPPNYDNTPRPTLFWAYPREFKDAKAAGQVKSSKHRFVSAHWASPIHWAAKGWVIMDDFALPVIGEGDAQPNDTFIDQIVMGSTAAVEYATSRGVCDPNRCAGEFLCSSVYFYVLQLIIPHIRNCLHSISVVGHFQLEGTLTDLS